MDYENKYLKYKNKYLKLKNQIGRGNPKIVPVDFKTYGYTLTNMIKDLISVSNSIYNYVLGRKSEKNTYLICVGQTPGYYALSMMNLPQYDKTKVQIIVLPYSSQINPTNEQELEYIRQLDATGIKFNSYGDGYSDINNEFYFLDQAQEGITIGRFLRIFIRASNSQKNYLLLLNSGGFTFGSRYISGVPVINNFTSQNLARFSDCVPRIVQRYTPTMFENTQMIIGFINIDPITNPIVEMIIDCSKQYPSIDTDWYRLNDFIPEQGH